jgi:hypothetical protein
MAMSFFMARVIQHAFKGTSFMMFRTAMIDIGFRNSMNRVNPVIAILQNVNRATIEPYSLRFENHVPINVISPSYMWNLGGNFINKMGRSGLVQPRSKGLSKQRPFIFAKRFASFLTVAFHAADNNVLPNT